MTILAPFATNIPPVRQPMPLIGDRRDLAVQPPHCVLIVLAIAGSVYPRLAEDAQAMLVCLPNPGFAWLSRTASLLLRHALFWIR
jgi:hypothetical protein